jgi:NAD(P)H dehydrogenase (quinone)
MTTMLVVYASDYQNTARMAKAVAAGVESVKDCQALLKSAEEATLDDMLSAQGVVLGTPVHMGSPDWRVKKFIDQMCSQAWMKDLMIGKVGGVFVSGSGYGSSGGGAELAMLALLNNLAELGMIIVPLPKSTPGYAEAGLQWGPCARTAGKNMEQIGISEIALQVATQHGANLARASLILAKEKVFTVPR